MKLWLLVTGGVILFNFLALNIWGKHYRPSGLLRGGVFVSIMAGWGIVSTIVCGREKFILYYPCNILSAIMTGLALSMFIVYKIRNRNYVKIQTEETETEAERRTS